MIDAKLDTLLKVNETQSFTKAAQQLALTQPAVSQHIKQLEKELDVKIFNRNENKLKLTKEGETVIKYARRIKALYTTLCQSLKDAKGHTDRLTVGVTHTAESNFVAEVLATYGSQNDGMTIILLTDTIQNLYERLKTYEIDLAVVEGRVTDDRFHSLLLDTDCLVLAVSNENPLAQKSLVTLDEIKQEKMILRRPNSNTRNLFSSNLEAYSMSIEEFNVILEVDNIATIKDLVRRNFGVSILAKSACYEEVKKGKMTVLPVENLSMIREINLVYNRDFEYMQVLQDIMRMYNETIKHHRD